MEMERHGSRNLFCNERSFICCPCVAHGGEGGVWLYVAILNVLKYMHINVVAIPTNFIAVFSHFYTRLCLPCHLPCLSVITHYTLPTLWICLKSWSCVVLCLHYYYDFNLNTSPLILILVRKWNFAALPAPLTEHVANTCGFPPRWYSRLSNSHNKCSVALSSLTVPCKLPKSFKRCNHPLTIINLLHPWGSCSSKVAQWFIIEAL